MSTTSRLPPPRYNLAIYIRVLSASSEFIPVKLETAIATSKQFSSLLAGENQSPPSMHFLSVQPDLELINKNFRLWSLGISL
jgi:hypothetical protein